MIRANNVVIRDFRGIKNLTLNLHGKNFGICGRNGTGKSGVVDAIEFALTGTISRLAGSGTGGMSVKEHGPHVDSRNKPDRASVALTLHVPSLNKDVTIERTVKDAKNPKVTPNDPKVRAVLAKIALHPEFTLSRRELIKYVLAEPGKRATEVQELLRLDELSGGRQLLQKIANACDRDAQIAKQARDRASEALRLALALPKLSMPDILAAANERRALLGLSPITAIEANTSIKEGIVAAATNTKPVRIAKAQAKVDTESLREHLKVLVKPEYVSSCAKTSAALGGLAKDQKFLENATRESLLKSALDAFEDDACPVCDTPWKPEDFRQHVGKKLEHFEAAAAVRKEVEQKLAPIISSLEATHAAAITVARYGALLQPALDSGSLNTYAANLAHLYGSLRKFLPIAETTEALAKASVIPSDVTTVLTSIEAAINALPEPSQQDAARDFLSVGQEKLEAYRQASLNLKAVNQQATVARHVFTAYSESVTKALEAIYQQVEESFSKLYRFINHDDEANFHGKLKPSMGKLGFDVDFYGRGIFPPGAYHSEGHQDAMGLCLYLALMNYLAGESFTFAVLDDVLMSIDAGHRREVSKMLLDQFPNTQFLLTTHDDIWLRHMKAVGLIESKHFVHFRTWSVDSGPTEWSDRDVWEEIADYLKKDDVRAAAALLRNYLEHFSTEACDQLRAPVEFRGSAQYTLGDLLPNATSRLRKHLRTAKVAAQSWGQDDKMAAIAAIEQRVTAAMQASNVEQWQVNAAVHYNNWADLNKNDFVPVVESYKVLVDAFTCAKCSGLLFVSPPIGTSDALRCGCGDLNLNLTKKS